VLQGLKPGIATFADVCDGVEIATGLEYMPGGLVSAPFKRAVKDELCALFASVTGNCTPGAVVSCCHCACSKAKTCRSYCLYCVTKTVLSLRLLLAET
jgi:hypothetical protein